MNRREFLVAGAGMMLEGNDMKTCEQLAGFLSEKHYI